MKRLLITISICLLITGFPTTCFAGNLNPPAGFAASEVQWHIHTFVTSQIAKTKGKKKVSTRKQTVTKTKTIYYKNASGKVMWYVRVTGTFSIKNNTAQCIRSKVTAVSKDKSWVITRKSAYMKGNQAVAMATGKHYLSRKKAETVTRRVKLTANSSGHFS